jgi:hypothetical protein
MELHAVKSSVEQSALRASVLSLLFATGVPAAGLIPTGTILPVRLNSTVSSATSRTGQVITARVMQDVPIPGGPAIHAGAKVMGRVVRVASATLASPASVTLEFDALQTRGERIPITTNLRAIASFVAVEQAKIPASGPDRGTPESAFTTTQVGGEVVYRGGGRVEGTNGMVGEPVPGGVLSYLHANPEGGCRGALDPHDALQALWVFSSDACGAYGLPHLTIRETTGRIILDAAIGQVNIGAGAGLLLGVNTSGVAGT